MPYVAEYSACAFDCALSGPFEGLFSARISASRTLCMSITNFISASTVFVFQFSPKYHFEISLSTAFFKSSYRSKGISISEKITFITSSKNSLGNFSTFLYGRAFKSKAFKCSQSITPVVFSSFGR